MSLINVSLNLVAYADALKNVNPSVKFTDLKWSLMGLPTDQPQMIPIALAPGVTLTIMSLARTLSYNGSTSFVVVEVPGSTDAQIQASFGQRTGRTDGDGTTQWEVTRTANLTKLHFTGTGTAPNFSSMQIGDGVTLGTGFNTFNQGDFTIVNLSVSGAFIEFVNPVGAAETVAAQVDVYSKGPVQVGDVLDISSGAFSFPNQGQFKITRVTDSFIEFSNPNVVPETVTGITSGLVVYPVAAKWMLMAVDHKLKIAFNGESTFGTEVEPPVDGDINNNPGLLLKRGKIFQLDITNPGLSVASGFVFLSE
jgi:hypothetical protein